MSEYVVQDIHARLEDDNVPRAEAVSAKLREVILAHELSQERVPFRGVELFSKTPSSAARLVHSIMNRSSTKINVESRTDALLIFRDRTTIPNLVGYCMLSKNTNVRELTRRDIVEHPVGPVVDIVSVVLADGDDERFREINELIVSEYQAQNPFVALEPISGPEMIRKSLQDVYGNPLVGGFTRGNNNKVIQTAAFGLASIL